MDGLTTGECAQLFRVSPKCVRQWVDAGLPLLREGARGAGNQHMIDASRVVAWVRTHAASTTQQRVALNVDKLFAGGTENFLKTIVARHYELQLRAVAVALEDWFADASGRSGSPAALGLTRDQAGVLAVEILKRCALHAHVATTMALEAELEQDTGADLDGWASALAGIDVRSAWALPDAVKIPPALAEFV